MITPERFREATGRDPEQDDLERCNCPKAGEIMHTQCGWDISRNMPRFIAADQRARATVPLQTGALGDEIRYSHADIAYLHTRIAALEAENAILKRAGWQVLAHKQATDIAAFEAEHNDLKQRHDAVSAALALSCENYDRDVVAKDARIAELKSELAAFTIANVSPVQDTETPKLNPFRDFPTDPRRMGPAPAT